MLIKLGIGILAIIGVLLGAELVVSGSKKLARSFGLSEFFIGLTLLSIGTSLPEIFTHIIGSKIILSEPDIAHTTASVVMGTNVGSNLFQITMITGVVGLVGTITTNKLFMKRDYMFMLVAILMLWIFGVNGYISRLEGLLLLVSYIVYLFSISYDEEMIEKIGNHRRSHWILSSSYIVLGLIVLFISADRVLHIATYFSEYFKISGSLIGALIIGVCTALPELTTAIFALYKGSSGLSLGTLVGSNITNPMMAVGVGTIISPYFMDFDVEFLDIPFWFVVSLLGYFLMSKRLRLRKSYAFILIICYLIYLPIRMART